MSALRARSEWLAHLRYCTRCPTDMCDRGLEMHAAVEKTMLPGESWQGVYVPEKAANYPIFRPWPDEPGEYSDGV